MKMYESIIMLTLNVFEKFDVDQIIRIKDVRILLD